MNFLLRISAFSDGEHETKTNVVLHHDIAVPLNQNHDFYHFIEEKSQKYPHRVQWFPLAQNAHISCNSHILWNTLNVIFWLTQQQNARIKPNQREIPIHVQPQRNRFKVISLPNCTPRFIWFPSNFSRNFIRSKPFFASFALRTVTHQSCENRESH